MSRSWDSPGVPGSTSMPTRPWTSKLAPAEAPAGVSTSRSDWLMVGACGKRDCGGGVSPAPPSVFAFTELPSTLVGCFRAGLLRGGGRRQAAPAHVPEGGGGEHGHHHGGAAEPGKIPATHRVADSGKHGAGQDLPDIAPFRAERPLVADEPADPGLGDPLGPGPRQHVLQRAALPGYVVEDDGGRFVDHPGTGGADDRADAQLRLLAAERLGVLPAEVRIESADTLQHVGRGRTCSRRSRCAPRRRLWAGRGRCSRRSSRVPGRNSAAGRRPRPAARCRRRPARRGRRTVPRAVRASRGRPRRRRRGRRRSRRWRRPLRCSGRRRGPWVRCFPRSRRPGR